MYTGMGKVWSTTNNELKMFEMGEKVKWKCFHVKPKKYRNIWLWLLPLLATVHSLQGALTQLIQYYHRFHKVLSQRPFASLPVRSELMNIHNVMVEVKKHKPTF